MSVEADLCLKHATTAGRIDVDRHFVSVEGAVAHELDVFMRFDLWNRCASARHAGENGSAMNSVAPKPDFDGGAANDRSQLLSHGADKRNEAVLADRSSREDGVKVRHLAFGA